MASRPIIKHLNIIEYFRSRCFTGFEDVATYFLLLQAAEEGLHRHGFSGCRGNLVGDYVLENPFVAKQFKQAVDTVLAK